MVDYSCPQLALEFVEENRPDLVISDQRMPLMQGSEMLSKIKAVWPDVHTIILSGYSDFGIALRCIQSTGYRSFLSVNLGIIMSCAWL